jgi:hypothetical protein
MRLLKLIPIFLLGLCLTACQYQDGAKLISKTFGQDAVKPSPVKEGSFRDLKFLKDLEISESTTLTDDMDNFLGEYVQITTGEYDSLVEYDLLFKLMQDNDEKLFKLHSNLFVKFLNTNVSVLVKNEKVAFWINAYNFFAIHTILDNFIIGSKKIKSIMDIPNAFDAIKFHVAGEYLSLNEMEKKRLVPIVTNGARVDARIHFAVICAALGCPVLKNEAYHAQTLNEELSEITKIGLKLKRNYNPKGSKTYLSEIFSWYRNDFSNHLEIGSSVSATSIKEFIKSYNGSNSSVEQIKFNKYNWNLNKVLR